MGFISNWYTREAKVEIKKDTPPKEGAALFFDVLRREFWELCKLNLMLILFCVPVVTMPAALTAMSRVIMFMLMDRPVSTFGEFFDTFKKEWKRSAIMGLIYFPLLALTVFGQYFYLAAAGSFLPYAVAMLSCAMVLIAGFYMFPMLAVLDLGLAGILKNAILLTFLRMPQNILALIVAVLLALLVLMLLPLSILAALFILFALIGLVTTFCAYTGLKKHVIKQE